MERLGEVVVGADLEADHLVGDLVPGREHDDRHLALLADLAADRQPIHAWQHDVQDDEVGLHLGEAGDRIGSVGDGLDLVTLPAEVDAGQLQDVLLVVDDEDLLIAHAN